MADDHSLVNGAIVLGERIDGEPCVAGTLQPPSPQNIVKQEGLVQAVPLPCGQEVVDAAAVTAVAVTTAAVTTAVARKRPRRSETWLPTVGGRCRARFEHDGSLQWFEGRIVRWHFNGFEVHFDDGDKRHLPGWRLHEVEQRMQAPTATEPQSPLSHLPLLQPPSPPQPPPPLPPQPPREGGSERSTASSSAPQHLPAGSIRTKLEQEQRAASDADKSAEELQREALRSKWQVEPDGVTPRHVFRKGNHARDISNVMGGVACDPFPVAVKDWGLPDGHVFLRKGDCYVAGTAGWNQWAPSFPGDGGMIESYAADRLGAQQKLFHMFRECVQNPGTRQTVVRPRSAFHGELAVGGYIYLGRYELDVDEDGDLIQQEISFNQMALDKECFPEAQRTRIEELCEYCMKGKARVEDRFFRRDDEGDAKARTLAACRRQLEEYDEVETLVGIRFVDYDERLYAELKRIGATKRDDKPECPLAVLPTRSQAQKYRGRVEIDPSRLGRLG